VRKSALLELELLAFTRSRISSLDLPGLIREEVELTLSLTSGVPDHRELGDGGSALPKDLLVRGKGEKVLLAGEAVQEGGLRGGGQEAARLMLPVHLDQGGAELRERGDRGELASDPCRRSPVAADGTGQDDLAVLDPVPRTRRRIESSLYTRRPIPFAHEGGPASPTEGEGEADGDHRLAGAGLAGEDVQPGVKLEIEVIDDPQATDVELPEHARMLDGGSDIGIAGQLELLPHAGQEVVSRAPADEPSRAFHRDPDLDPRPDG
jgi:hypothetical protein